MLQHLKDQINDKTDISLTAGHIEKLCSLAIKKFQR